MLSTLFAASDVTFIRMITAKFTNSADVDFGCTNGLGLALTLLVCRLYS